MGKTPRVTSREEMEAVITGRGPLGGERVIDYNIFLTDAFNAQPVAGGFLDAAGPTDQIDGFANDDSYRRSRHLLLSKSGISAAAEANLRENSLARQVDEKDDRPAVIRLIRRRRPEELAALNVNEPRVPWINIIPPNTKFFLEQVQENRAEKVQIIDTFGEWIAFFLGRTPEVYTYAGTLLNTKNHNWKNEFQENYDHFLRGSKSVQNRASIVLQYDDVMVEGYMIDFSLSMNSMADKATPFTFNVLVMNRSPMDPRGMIGLRQLRSGGTDAELELFNDMQQALDLTMEGKIDDLETFLLMREYFSGFYVPGAGTSISRPDAGNLESTTSRQPGDVGGSANARPAQAPFSNSTSLALEGTGQFLPRILEQVD